RRKIKVSQFGKCIVRSPRPIIGLAPQRLSGGNLNRESYMIIGVPKEVKDHETRVGLVPSGVSALREAGHDVLVESHAGEGSSLTDREYMAAGASILESAADVWSKADLVVKVKEPQSAEYNHFRPGLILF